MCLSILQILNLRIISFLLGCLLLLVSLPLTAQEVKTTRILFIVDGSSSMQELWGAEGQSKFLAAQQLLSTIVDSIFQENKNIEFGLRVFGAQYHVSKNICYDSKLEVGFAKLNNDQVKGRLQLIYPKGVSPIAYSLEKAALEDIIDPRYAYSIILITDGGETCNGDLCAVMDKILKYRINFKPYIISLVNSSVLKDEYACIGKFMIVEKKSDMPPVISEIMKDNDYFKADENTKYVHQPEIPQTTYTPPSQVDTPQVEVPNVPNQQLPLNDNTLVRISLANAPKPRLRFIPKPITESIVNLIPIPVINIQFTEEPTPVVSTPPKSSIPTPNHQKLAFVMPEKQWRLTLLYNIPTAERVKLLRIPPIKILDDPTPPPVLKQPEIKHEPPVVTQSSSDPTKSGAVRIFLTNGKGKYYASNPPIKITEIGTNKEVYTGVRGTGPNGEPETMELPDGEYEIVLTSSGRKANFKVTKGNITRVEIIVGQGSLAFRYAGSKDVPRDYIAVVSQRFNPAFEAVDQPTETILTYDPSNYHIEVNTLPPLLLNLVIDSDKLYVADIPREGIIQITNENEIGRIDFFHVSGAGTNKFYQMNIYGDPEYQQAKFLPGKYLVRYVIRDPNTGALRERAKEFNIRSNETVSLFLD